MKLLKCVFTLIEKHFGSVLISLAIIAAALIYAYYNLYQSCKRDLYENNRTTAKVCSGYR